MQEHEFIALFQPLCEWYGRTPNPVVIEAYYEELKILTLEELKAAIKAAIANEAFMPPAVKLYALIRGSSEQNALAQWQRALAGASRGDRAKDCGLDEAAIAAIEKMGGLFRLGAIEESQVQKWQSQFVALYKDAVMQAKVVQLKALPGGRNGNS